MGAASRIGLETPDKRWLTEACEWMSAEVALVDAIELFQAQAAIQHEIELLKSAVA